MTHANLQIYFLMELPNVDDKMFGKFSKNCASSASMHLIIHESYEILEINAGHATFRRKQIIQKWNINELFLCVDWVKYLEVNLGEEVPTPALHKRLYIFILLKNVYYF